jgi:hypothetical protein
MLPRKTGKPIAFKCTEELRQQTEAIADSLGESLSDYVRKAVAYYNLVNSAQNVVLDSTHKNNTVSNEQTAENLFNVEIKHGQVVKKQPEPFKSFPKGGGKK